MNVTAMPRPPLATTAALEERRALVRAAQAATDRAGRGPEPAQDLRRAPATRRTLPLSSTFEQAAYVTAAWSFAVPLMFGAPFFCFPPLWISALTQSPAQDAPPPPPLPGLRSLC
jgi:hypothetical protein